MSTQETQQATENGVVDGTATEVTETAMVHTPPPTLAVTPTVKAEELVERLDVIRQAMDNAMTADVDYGVIPGTNKPALLKPGAEKLAVLFQLDVQPVQEKVWGPGDHLTVSSVATVFHSPTGARLGRGEGMCTTREKKYAKRQQDRTCPECGTTNIKRSKFADNGDKGWYCFAKIGGCGAQFRSDDKRIADQKTGEVDNPELPDLWNTVVKMAEKRARVDAVLAVTGASALFTQDVEPPQNGGGHDPGPQEGAQAPEPVPDRISPADVAALVKGVKLAKIKADDVKAKLTSLGVEEQLTSVAQGLALLTNRQAEEFYVWMMDMGEAAKEAK